MVEDNNVTPKGEILVYSSEDGQVKIDVRLQNEDIWLTINQMAELFGIDKSGISRHLKNIYNSKELQEEGTVANFATVQNEGERRVSRDIEYYNLDAIISVGYRVNSIRGTQFRIWATQRLKEYLIKGFTMNDERLKNPPGQDSGIPDYFDEMLERIRDIRASEKRMYLRVKEIFAMAADYQPNREDTKKFFSIIQNKLHYAATGMTAAELIYSRANHDLPNMGLTNWKGDELRKTDIITAKNYLKEDEITELNRIVTMWLDFAEDKATRRKQIFMENWEAKLDEFLRFNDRNVLNGLGKVSKNTADEHANKEYEKFALRRREYKESLGEEEYLKELEKAANKLPESKKGKGK